MTSCPGWTSQWEPVPMLMPAVRKRKTQWVPAADGTRTDTSIHPNLPDSVSMVMPCYLPTTVLAILPSMVLSEVPSIITMMMPYHRIPVTDWASRAIIRWKHRLTRLLLQVHTSKNRWILFTENSLLPGRAPCLWMLRHVMTGRLLCPRKHVLISIRLYREVSSCRSYWRCPNGWTSGNWEVPGL